jgi:hypothetical protein
MSEILFDRPVKHKFEGNVMYKGPRNIVFTIIPSGDLVSQNYHFFLYYNMYYRDNTVRKVCQKIPDLNYILRKNQELNLFAKLVCDRPDHIYSPVKYYSLEMLVFEKNQWEFKSETLRNTIKETDSGLILACGFSRFQDLEDEIKSMSL